MSETRRHRALISSDLSVEFEVTADGMLNCHWLPALPRKLTRPQLRRYRRARDAFVRKTFPGLKVMVAEL